MLQHGRYVRTANEFDLDEVIDLFCNSELYVCKDLCDYVQLMAWVSSVIN